MKTNFIRVVLGIIVLMLSIIVIIKGNKQHYYQAAVQKHIKYYSSETFDNTIASSIK